MKFKYIYPTNKILIGFFCLFLSFGAVSNEEVRCTEGQPNYVKQKFENEAIWSMCWTYSNEEGIRLEEVSYTTESGVHKKILSRAALAQVFVPYDDGKVRFHDLTSYDFGGEIVPLNTEACPKGDLIKVDTDYGFGHICVRKVLSKLPNPVSPTGSVTQDHLLVYSSHQVGNYNYLPEWKFYANGTIEAGIGATGALQRQSIIPNNQKSRLKKAKKTGWVMKKVGPNQKKSKIGISHTHNYYWRLDFDLDGTEFNDELLEVDYVKAGGKIEKQYKELKNESARKYAKDRYRTWSIKDKAQGWGYTFIPGDFGHHFVGVEKFSKNEFYITEYDKCEKFASQNNIIGNDCSDSGKTLDAFIQSNNNIEAKDIVLWYSLSLHHIPRSEEQPNMDTHWNRFQLVPTNL